MGDTSLGAQALIVCAGVGVASVLLFIRKWQVGRDGKSQRSTNLPLPPTERGYVPFAGVALSFFKDVNGYLSEKRRQHGECPFRFHLLGRKWTMVNTQEDMRHIVAAAETDLSMLSAFESLIGGLLPVEFGFINRTHFFQGSMRSHAMQSFVSCWHELLSSELATTMWGEDGRVELFDACKRLIMRLNLRGLLGPLILKDGRYEAYYQAFEDIDPEKSLVDVLGSLFSPSKKEDAWRRVKAITSELIAHYEAMGTQEEEEECTLHGLVRAAAKEGRRLDAAEACGHIFAFSFASLTNTFAVRGPSYTSYFPNDDHVCFLGASHVCGLQVLAWCLLELLPRPALRARIEAELNQPHEDASRLEFYDGLPVTKALINEVIRLHTPGLLFRRVLGDEGTTLSTGHHVPSTSFLSLLSTSFSLCGVSMPSKSRVFSISMWNI